MRVTVASPHDQPPDQLLVRRVRKGDEHAFRALYERHTPRLKMLVRRLIGRRAVDADDVIQEAWMSACRGLDQYRGDAKFSTWLTSIAVRAAYAALARRLDEDVPLLDDVPAPNGNGAASTVDLERALAALPDRQRLVVVLHDVEGFTHEEIAEQLGMAVGSSKASLSRARYALRQMLTGGIVDAHR